ncbi:hypothetical protein EUGRSUZ_E01158 [Eucalyptus grandis]|uniref:Uncharacterized protein n=2 Tax=Eucalyptus grandis TaxID=71139 RepID=A0ACC3KTG2_EUCGR|nr:hypothetical protein EUGRSUZ_E01158 [Eucalyptus grandis]
MSWVGWNQTSESFHLALAYGAGEDPGHAGVEDPTCALVSLTASSGSGSGSSLGLMSPRDQEAGPGRIELDWMAGDDEDQVALRLQSQLMVAMSAPLDTVAVELSCRGEDENVGVDMRVVKRREPLKAVKMSKTSGSAQQSDGMGVLTRLLQCNFVNSGTGGVGEGSLVCGEHWRTVTVVSLFGCGLSVSAYVRFS